MLGYIPRTTRYGGSKTQHRPCLGLGCSGGLGVSSSHGALPIFGIPKALSTFIKCEQSRMGLLDQEALEQTLLFRGMIGGSTFSASPMQPHSCEQTARGRPTCAQTSYQACPIRQKVKRSPSHVQNLGALRPLTKLKSLSLCLLQPHKPAHP